MDTPTDAERSNQDLIPVHVATSEHVSSPAAVLEVPALLVTINNQEVLAIVLGLSKT